MLAKTNLEFSRWSEVFRDATLTAALLDRLTHHSQVLLFDGESYRFRESAGRLTKSRRKTSWWWSTFWQSTFWQSTFWLSR